MIRKSRFIMCYKDPDGNVTPMNELFESMGMAKAMRDHYSYKREDLGEFELRRAVIIIDDEVCDEEKAKEIH